MKNAFTMVELVFVIVILGILSAIAIPKFAATRTDAQIAKGRADISSIRSSIVNERQARLVQGQSGWITKLSHNGTTLFDGNGTSELLMYGIAAGRWQATDATYKNYTYTVQSTSVAFTYDSATGKFTCNTTTGTQAQQDMCKKLIN